MLTDQRFLLKTCGYGATRTTFGRLNYQTDSLIVAFCTPNGVVVKQLK